MHAVLARAIGDPRIEVGKLEFAIIAGLRFKLDLYVNLRPIKLYTSRCAAEGQEAGRRRHGLCARTPRTRISASTATQEGHARRDRACRDAVHARGTERIIRYAFELAKSAGRSRAKAAE
jgi:3-isopropylmalate dehydrogenase